MKLHHSVKSYTSHTLKLLRKKTTLTSVIFLSIMIIGVFLVTRGVAPHTSELSYIESSSLGKEAGSVVPASCDSATPFTSPTAAGGTAGSHTNGDCTTPCPGGVGAYDPYYDPTQTGCPAPSVTLTLAPTAVTYGGGFSSLTLSSTGASDCYLYYLWAGGAITLAGAVPVNNVWGASGPLSDSLSYIAVCYNGAANFTWSNWTTITVTPTVPTGLSKTCNNAAGTNATIAWNASAGASQGYYLRIDFPVGQACPAGWQRGGGTGNVCYPNPDTYGALSYTFTTNTSQAYTWQVYGRNLSTYSAAAASSVTCNQSQATLTVPTCTMLNGASTCNTSVSWTSSDLISPLSVRQNNVQFSALPSSGGVMKAITYAGGAANTFTAVQGGVPLDTKTTSATCAVGSWDSTYGVCTDPQVVSSSIVGQYYPLGTLRFTCNADALSYSITKDTAPTVVQADTPYVGPVTINTIAQGNTYVIKCTHGSVSGQASRGYNPTPGSAVVNLNITPTTISKDQDVIVKWDTTFPTNACTLTARVVCANSACTAAQTAAQTALNTLISSTVTDANDPSTSRNLTTAIQTPAPGHRDSDSPVIVADYRALGKKTLRISYTTDLIYDCGAGKKEVKRVQVTKNNEQ